MGERFSRPDRDQGHHGRRDQQGRQDDSPGVGSAMTSTRFSVGIPTGQPHRCRVAAAALLPWFLAVGSERRAGPPPELRIRLAPDEAELYRCSHCGTPTRKVHEKTVHEVRDLPLFDARTYLEVTVCQWSIGSGASAEAGPSKWPPVTATRPTSFSRSPPLSPESRDEPKNTPRQS
jgi:hypothetical protein